MRIGGYFINVAPFLPTRNLISRTVLLACAAIALSGQLMGVGVMVNEYRAGTGGAVTSRMSNDEFIEFVLTTDATAAELAALTFGDTNHQTRRMNAVFQFNSATLSSVLASSGRSNFLAGTIIVVKGAGLGGQNLSYNPLSSNISDSDQWGIELVAGLGALDHPETNLDGTLDMDRRGDVVWISTDNPPSNSMDTSGFIHAIGHDDVPGDIANAVIAQFGAANILASSFASARTIQNIGDSNVALTATLTSSMAEYNSVSNQTWIENTLRATAVPEPSRAVLCLMATCHVLLRRRRTKAI